MLMVGYDSKRKFFVVKNQWGPTNYTAIKNKLAPGWKDVVRYNGYTLVDYNYLPQCAEAHYITEAAPVGSPRFTAQRALGEWLVTFKNDDKTLMKGVLCWRHLPENVGLKNANLRIGDLVTTDRQQFRVNAKLEGDGTKPYQVTLYVDFATGAIPVDSTNGATWKGTLSLPDKGDSTLKLSPAGQSKQSLWGVEAAQVQITATQVGNRNLLIGMTPP
jgi:hypothetical protein